HFSSSFFFTHQNENPNLNTKQPPPPSSLSLLLSILLTKRLNPDQIAATDDIRPKKKSAQTTPTPPTSADGREDVGGDELRPSP
ncbi:hypothetical protein LINPERHAP1_LOCUS7982, partial [Linum perenne]